MFKRLVLFAVLLLVPVSSAWGEWYKSPYTLKNAPAIYWNGGFVMSSHECTHGVNGMLRNKYGKQCFYFTDTGKFLRIPKTGVTLSAVARSVKYRGSNYSLYLVQQQQWWNDTGLYVFEEWVAYANKSYIVAQYKDNGSHFYSLQSACEMGYYSHVLLQLTPDTYSHKKELTATWLWHAKRCVKLADEEEKRGVQYRAGTRPWREWLRSQIKKMEG